MARYALKIEYDGTAFSGWQRQSHAPSVQQAIEEALARLEPDLPSIATAGRTDAGVHAWGQVAHVDMTRDWDAFRLSEAMNHHLKPNRIAIVGCAAVPETFHARFSAKARHYVYRLVSRRAPLTHNANGIWAVRHALILDQMQNAARYLVGQHDFTTFRASECQADSPVRTLDRLDVSQHDYPGGTEFRFDVRARSFLHSQVRSFVGTLERVGAGSWDPDRVRDALHAMDRATCGPVAPPDGLYLAHVVYDPCPFD